jgi:glycosyltransferase involved in cell wall biosynthesis
MTAAGSPRVSVVAALPPLVVGAAPANAVLVDALRAAGAVVDVVSWRRHYPALLYRRGQSEDGRIPHGPAFLLDWHDPRTWRLALARIAAFGADAVVLPWLHPVLAPPYRFLLRRLPRRVSRVLVCHNVAPHERFPGARALTSATLRHSDLVVTHAPHQRDELRELGLAATPVIEAFHPRFPAAPVDAREAAAERARLGKPGLLLLSFGAVRPYKGVDDAVEALAEVDPAVDAHLVVAGRFWGGTAEIEERVRRLRLERRVVLRDGYVAEAELPRLFAAADAVLLPYRSATQSGVVQLAFAYGRPVIATRVGGIPAAVRDGVDGLLCPPGDPSALARTIESAARRLPELTAGVRPDAAEYSPRRYAQLLLQGIAEAR